MSPAGATTAGKTELLWLGQASFRIKSPGGKVIVVDPWLTAGPKAPAAYKDLASLGKVDLLLVTHAHVDHLSDAPAIAKPGRQKVSVEAPGPFIFQGKLGSRRGPQLLVTILPGGRDCPPSGFAARWLFSTLRYKPAFFHQTKRCG